MLNKLVQEKIHKADQLHDWLQSKIENFPIPPSDKIYSGVGIAELHLTLEVCFAIKNLVASELVGSAFTLLRTAFEAYVRSVWLIHIASEKDREKVVKNDSFPNLWNLIQKVENFDPDRSQWMKIVKKKNSQAFNSLIHGGSEHINRRWKRTPKGFDIVSNYATEEIIRLIGFSIEISIRCAFELLTYFNKIDELEELGTVIQDLPRAPL